MIYLSKLKNSEVSYMDTLYPSLNGNIRPITGSDPNCSGSLYDYYIKTAYNACSGGSYKNDFVDVTLGSIYEQFGSGLVLRAYEDRALGYDNMLDGARLIVRPYKGIVLKGVYGYQRLSFQQGQIVHGEGIVRGFDAEINFKETFDSLLNDNWDFGLGFSFVSKFQADNDDALILPQNVGAYGGRFKARYKNINFSGEYILKEQDPSNDNSKIYNYGHAAIFNLLVIHLIYT